MAMPPSGSMPPPMAPPGTYPAQMPPKRPIGVAILAILSFLGGLVEIAEGLGLIAIAAMAAGTIDLSAYGPLAAFIGILGIVLLQVGIITIVVAIGLWKMRWWAWWIEIIVNVISILIAIGTYSWFSLVLPLIIVIYLVVIRDKFGIGARPAGM